MARKAQLESDVIEPVEGENIPEPTAEIEELPVAAEVVAEESALTDEVNQVIDPEPEPVIVEKPASSEWVPDLTLADRVKVERLPYSVIRDLRFEDADGRVFYLDDYSAGDVFILRPLN